MRKTRQCGKKTYPKKTIELYKLFYEFSKLFPKKDRYTLGAACERYLLSALELLLEISYLSREAKRAKLAVVSNKFETLKILVRLLKELKIIDQKKYFTLQAELQEIGKMIGGWIKSTMSF